MSKLEGTEYVGMTDHARQVYLNMTIINQRREFMMEKGRRMWIHEERNIF